LAGKDRKYVLALIKAGMKRDKRKHNMSKKKAKAAASVGTGIDAFATAAITSVYYDIRGALEKGRTEGLCRAGLQTKER